MSSGELDFLSLSEAAGKLRAKEVSAREVTRSFYERAERAGSALNCFTALPADRALAEAEVLDAELAAGSLRGPLHGVPVTVKDSIATQGVETSVGSAFFEGWVPDADAEAVRRLRAAGAIVVAKTNLYELAFGAPSPRFGPVRNPWSPERSTGGSSSGSVAAVAAGLAYGSLGTDTGGSIRVPSAFCGVVGLKPTYDRVSREGLVPLAFDLDHVGPIARRVGDVALLFRVLSGSEKTEADHGALDGLVLGRPAAQPGERIDPEVDAAVEEASRTLESLGAELVDVRLPDLLLARIVLWVIASVEGAEYFRPRRLQAGETLHPLVERRLRRGEEILGVDFVRAQRARRRLAEELTEAVRTVDALLLPVAPIPAYGLGVRRVDVAGLEEDVSYAVTRYTPIFSLAGWPAISVPCGFTAAGLPLGFQLAARPCGEELLFRVASAYEAAAGWYRRRPPEPVGERRG